MQQKPKITETQKEVYRCKTCDSSKNDKKLFTCAGCHTAYFCSRECQKKEWPRHKIECLAIQEINKKMKETSIEAQADVKMLRAWGKHHAPYLSSLVSNALRLCELPNAPNRVVVLHLEMRATESAEKKFKINEITPGTHASFKENAKQLGLPDLESLPSRKGYLTGFCLLFCPPVADMFPFEFEADPSSHKVPRSPDDMVKFCITQINNGEKYDMKFRDKK